jgi:hypothetical protein
LRFVYRLCLRLGIDDPEEWMNTVGRDRVDRWLLYCGHEPLSQPWDHTAAVCTELYRISQMLAAKVGVELPERTADSWIPAIYTTPALTPLSKTPEAARGYLEAMFRGRG